MYMGYLYELEGDMKSASNSFGRCTDDGSISVPASKWLEAAQAYRYNGDHVVCAIALDKALAGGLGGRGDVWIMCGESYAVLGKLQF